MEAETVPSLTPLISAADQWHEFLLLLPLLIALEAILSADNAIALAAISRRLNNQSMQQRALNIGLLIALVLRLCLIVAAKWILNFWPLQLAASIYLLWLSGKQLLGTWTAAQPLGEANPTDQETAPKGETGAELQGTSQPHPPMRRVVLTLALTDLAFSLDSIAAAVAVTDRLLIVMTGGVIGIVALRLTAGLFTRWLEIFPNLETAGYLAVALVGLRLLMRVLTPQLTPPEWLLLLSVAGLLLWGFSTRKQLPPEAEVKV